MAKLHFHYSTMNAGKSTLLLQAAYNYKEMGMETLLLTADFDDRTENGKITSRIGISEQAELYSQGSDLLSLIEKKTKEKALACVLVDEAQWLSPSQVWQLAQVVDDLRLLAIADEMREVRTICHCGSKATMVVRKDSDGKVQTSGDQVQVGGNEMYFSLCRLHWRQAVKGD